MSPPLATVVIVNWNGAHLLPACLDALAKQDVPFAFDTWVVDNASKDDSVELLTSRYPSVRVLSAPGNLGFAGGNNFALREVTTPYAVLLNNDAVPEPDWLRNLLAPFQESTGAALGLGAVTGKVLFLPSFARLSLATEGFVPGLHDSRELGVRISSLRVDGEEMLPAVLWERLTYGAEGPPDGRFFWTRPSGELLIPVARERPATRLRVELTWSAERSKPVTLSWPGGSVALTVGAEPTTVKAELPAELPLVDVVNNAGGVVLAAGYGADRAYQQVDDGVVDEAVEVFTACGNGMAMRTSLGHQLGWFDDDFFLYYEDTDLSWRMRAAGWTVRYVPAAVAEHLHAASSGVDSPVFRYYNTRNSLIVVTRHAPKAVAARSLVRQSLGLVRAVLRAPTAAPTRARARGLCAHLVRLPRTLGVRRRVWHSAEVSRAGVAAYVGRDEDAS